MPLTRADAAQIAAAEFSELLAALGVGTADASGALKEPLDAALRLIGVAESGLPSATVADSDAETFLAALRWTVLRRLRNAAAARVTISAPGLGVSKAASDYARHLDGLVEQARQEVVRWGIAAAAMGAGSLLLDFIEPEEVTP
jgi:hypothetical protein